MVLTSLGIFVKRTWLVSPPSFFPSILPILSPAQQTPGGALYTDYNINGVS